MPSMSKTWREIRVAQECSREIPSTENALEKKTRLLTKATARSAQLLETVNSQQLFLQTLASQLNIVQGKQRRRNAASTELGAEKEKNSALIRALQVYQNQLNEREQEMEALQGEVDRLRLENQSLKNAAVGVIGELHTQVLAPNAGIDDTEMEHMRKEPATFDKQKEQLAADRGLLQNMQQSRSVTAKGGQGTTPKEKRSLPSKKQNPGKLAKPAPSSLRNPISRRPLPLMKSPNLPKSKPPPPTKHPCGLNQDSLVLEQASEHPTFIKNEAIRFTSELNTFGQHIFKLEQAFDDLL
ncbi:hypothetical protein DFJ77DRAFT_441869 [Powellomyces hirtus]|nr:hypothetical protein DFJ77DRAFT_444203 [Powellomyces hirtus]KAI8910585.1 hypothetical protein DFJ77DRAFT_441869 [Powellomyces hirtus]